ncbi:hypothetical protein HY992_00625 [Candidatus Micrarchaeota archaeon]|nr:hypothetical protein [Candidatus Micrarchaeota archaeon]
MSNAKQAPSQQGKAKTVAQAHAGTILDFTRYDRVHQRPEPSQTMRVQASQAIEKAKPDFKSEELIHAVNAVCSAISAGIPTRVCSDALEKSLSALGFASRLGLLVDAQSPDVLNEEIWRIAFSAKSAGVLSALLESASKEKFRHAFAEKSVSEFSARELEDLAGALEPNSKGLEGKAENVPIALARLFCEHPEQRENFAGELRKAFEKAGVNVEEIRGRVDAEFAGSSDAQTTPKQYGSETNAR